MMDFSELIQNFYDMVLISDVKGTIVYANSMAEMSLNKSKKELEKSHLKDIFGEDEAKKLMDEMIERDISIGKDVFLCSSKLFKSEGKEYLGVFAKNITIVAALEKDTLKQRIRQVEDSRLHSMQNIAGDLAHEVNNPLMILTGHFFILESLIKKYEVDDKKIAKMFKTIDGTIDRIKKAVNDKTKMVSFVTNAKPVKLRLKDFLIETLEPKRENLRTESFEVNLDGIPDELNVTINTYSFGRVVLELVNNTIYFLKGHDTEDKWIKCWTNVNEEEHVVELYYQDSGSGVDTFEKSQIFEPFYTTKGIGEGLGSGLPQALEVCLSHGGNLEYLEKEKNTTFKITLPII
jgi:nitrogen-specific signal transduction histidine kinase